MCPKIRKHETKYKHNPKHEKKKHEQNLTMNRSSKWKHGTHAYFMANKRA